MRINKSYNWKATDKSCWTNLGSAFQSRLNTRKKNKKKTRFFGLTTSPILRYSRLTFAIFDSIHHINTGKYRGDKNDNHDVTISLCTIDGARTSQFRYLAPPVPVCKACTCLGAQVSEPKDTSRFCVNYHISSAIWYEFQRWVWHVSTIQRFRSSSMIEEGVRC